MNYLLKKIFIIIFTMRTFTFGGYSPGISAQEFQKCPICLEDLCLNLNINSLECGHIFHPECISKWFEVKPYRECPLCRDRSFNNPEEGIDKLINACNKLSIELLKTYIAMHADVNGQNSTGSTPLHAACLIKDNACRYNIIECLLEAGACNFETKNSNNFTALELLAFTDRIDSILQITDYCLSKKGKIAYYLSGIQCQNIIQLVAVENKNCISECISKYKNELRSYHK